MDSEMIFQKAASQQGWNKYSQTSVLLEFIEQECKTNELFGNRFQEYIEDRVTEDRVTGDRVTEERGEEDAFEEIK